MANHHQESPKNPYNNWLHFISNAEKKQQIQTLSKTAPRESVKFIISSLKKKKMKSKKKKKSNACAVRGMFETDWLVVRTSRAAL